MDYILRVTWTNGITEVLRSNLAGADFRLTVPCVAAVEELAESLSAIKWWNESHSAA